MDAEMEKLFFNQLCQENYKRILQYLVVKVHDYDIAEDLIQGVFLVAWEKRAILVSHPNPPGFLYTTARNKALVYLRQRQKEPLPLGEDWEFPSAEEDIDDFLAGEADRAIDEGRYIQRALAPLNYRDKRLYQDFYLENRSVRDIAGEEGVAEVTVRMRLMRLRQKVKKEAKKIFNY